MALTTPGRLASGTAVSRLAMRDPLLHVLIRIFGERPATASFVAVATYAVAFFGAGVAISSIYAGRTSQPFLPLLDPRELVFSLVVYGLVVPAVWWFYMREPQELTTVLKQLLENGILGTSETTRGHAATFVRNEMSAVNRKRVYSVIIGMATIGITAVWLPIGTSPQNQQLPAHITQHWWQVNSSVPLDSMASAECH